MRKIAILLIALGLAGLILGIVDALRATLAPGAVPFSIENYGGPGPILGALVLVLGGLYLFSSARRED